jgi:hypothetical protein
MQEVGCQISAAARHVRMSLLRLDGADEAPQGLKLLTFGPLCLDILSPYAEYLHHFISCCRKRP